MRCHKKCVIYLAGSCKCEADEGRGWRKQLQRDYKDDDFVEIINPLEYFSYSMGVHKTNKQVKEYYLSRIRNSDVLLVNLNNSNQSCGTCQEVQYAVDHDIPVIGFGTENVYAWLSEVDCQVVFDDINEAMDYIVDYYAA